MLTCSLRAKVAIKSEFTSSLTKTQQTLPVNRHLNKLAFYMYIILMNFSSPFPLLSCSIHAKDDLEHVYIYMS